MRALVLALLFAAVAGASILDPCDVPTMAHDLKAVCNGARGLSLFL